MAKPAVLMDIALYLVLPVFTLIVAILAVSAAFDRGE